MPFVILNGTRCKMFLNKFVFFLFEDSIVIIFIFLIVNSFFLQKVELS